MNVAAQKFQSQYALVCKSLAWSNHRTTLPQSRPAGVPAPSEREPGTGCTIHRTARKPQDCGQFSSPLRRAGAIHRGTLPQLRIRSAAPSEREPGMGGTIQRAAQKPQRCGRFSSPLRRAGSIHRGTLPQSASLTAPSEREPGMGCTIHRTAQKPQRCGRFSSPLRNSEYFTAQKLPVSTRKRYRVGQGTHV